MKKSSNSFSQLLSFCEFSAKALSKNLASEDVLWLVVTFRAFCAVEAMAFLFQLEPELALAATSFEEISAASPSAVVLKK